MELLILKIILIILLVRIIWLLIVHGIIIFWDKAAQDAVTEILKDPGGYVRNDHACKMMYDLIWFYVFIRLLISAFSGQITIN